LEIQRYYCGGNGEKGCDRHSFLYGWQLNHGAKLFTSTKAKAGSVCTVIKGSNRHGVLFIGDEESSDSCCPSSFFKKRVTNCGLGKIGVNRSFPIGKSHHKLIDFSGTNRIPQAPSLAV
jgi:hypothetical protein